MKGEHSIVRETREYLEQEFVDQLPEVKALREREPTAEEVARYAEVKLHELTKERTAACQNSLDLMTRFKTSFWFNTVLDERRMKRLLCTLHDMRTMYENQTAFTHDSVETALADFLTFLHLLEEEYQQRKTEMQSVGMK